MPELAIDRFAAHVGLRPGDYSALHQWSITHLADFWGAVWDFFELGPRTGPVLETATMPHARWFPEVELNYVDQVLRHAHLTGNAIVGIDQDGHRTEITWAELAARISATAQLLSDKGVCSGDRVAAYMPDGTVTL